MRPALKKVGLGWATFEVLSEDRRGHGLGVSLEVYSISGVQQKIDAAKRLESEVIQQ
jgi:hypothetical protein